MYFSSHSSDKQYFSSQKIDENVVFLATTQDKSGLTRRELPCVVTRNETLSGYRYCINIFDDGQYLQNIIVQFALSAICGRPPDQGKQDVRTILTREHDKIAAEYWNKKSGPRALGAGFWPLWVCLTRYSDFMSFT